MRLRFIAACGVIAASIVLSPSSVLAQATCVDSTGLMCLERLRTSRPDGVVDDIFQTSDGRYAPQLTFATLVRGVNGCIGQTYNPRILEGYTCGAIGTSPPGGNDPSFQANSLDWYWTQVVRTNDAGAVVADGASGFYEPSRGRIYDLGGEANRVVVFPITDHGPLPCEAFEYAVWLSNNPDATEIAPDGAPDPRLWNRAVMIRAFTQGWTRNPNATGAAERDRPDLGTHLRTFAGPGDDAVADSLATVWALPCGLTFRYVAMQAGNEGNPGPECVFHSSDDELDTIAGLNEDDTAICIDADGDGHRDAACGGSDCDDANPNVHPGAFERCDATMDLDCQEMAACPAGTLCDSQSGLCVTQCFEGGCAEGFTCVGDRCVDADCATRTEPCPEGTLCRGGECVAPCDGVVCPQGQRCIGGACIDPCDGVVCPSNQVCIARDPAALTLCGPACTCDEITISLCGEGTACDERPSSDSYGQCVDSGCENRMCGPGEVCSAGECRDGCEGVTCPRAQVCLEGECVPDLCESVVCAGSQVCRGGECFDACDGVSCTEGRICRDGACVPDPCFGISCGEAERCVAGRCVPTGGVDAGRIDAGRIDAGTGPGAMDPGCACRAGTSSSHGAPLFAMLVIALAILRRRR